MLFGLIPDGPNSKSDSKSFELPNFSQNKVINNDALYDENFRHRAIKALEGTLKHYEDRQAVAQILWDCRGNGLNAGEIRTALNRLAKAQSWPDDRTKAVFNKLGLYW